MKDLLRNCYYDGMTLQEAVDFITRLYGETPTHRQISNFTKTLAKDWK